MFYSPYSSSPSSLFKGVVPANMRSIRAALQFYGWIRLAKLVPAFIKAPKFGLHFASYKFWSADAFAQISCAWLNKFDIIDSYWLTIFLIYFIFLQIIILLSLSHNATYFIYFFLCIE